MSQPSNKDYDVISTNIVLQPHNTFNEPRIRT